MDTKGERKHHMKSSMKKRAMFMTVTTLLEPKKTIDFTEPDSSGNCPKALPISTPPQE